MTFQVSVIPFCVASHSSRICANAEIYFIFTKGSICFYKYILFILNYYH
jgi:hypothetical protein